MVKGLPKLALRLFAFLAFIALVRADIIYFYEGVEERVPLTQLWYEGHWKEIEPFTAPVTRSAEGDLRGKVVVWDRVPPFEPYLRALQKQNALAAVFIRPGKFPPGFGMQLVDASNRSDVFLPTMEAVYPKHTHLNLLAEGSIARFEPTPNVHKSAAESKYQLIVNLILSFWELTIMTLGTYRIYQFYALAQLPWLAVAPICCAFEVAAASLRFAYTVVDPFFTYRMISDSTSNILITISFPFSEAAGILLTLFWAESLANVQIRAVPFISVYKWPAIAAVATLFVVELLCDITRMVLKNGRMLPLYISIVIYVITAVTLITCYISCAVAIGRRLWASKSARKTKVLTMSIRLVISSGGYIIMAIGVIMFAMLLQRRFGRAATLTTVFCGLNLAGLMQVFALKPIRTMKTGSSFTGSGKTASDRTASDRTASSHTI